jgi:hypothetical protein
LLSWPVVAQKWPTCKIHYFLIPLLNKAPKCQLNLLASHRTGISVLSRLYLLSEGNTPCCSLYLMVALFLTPSIAHGPSLISILLISAWISLRSYWVNNLQPLLSRRSFLSTPFRIHRPRVALLIPDFSHTSVALKKCWPFISTGMIWTPHYYFTSYNASANKWKIQAPTKTIKPLENPLHRLVERCL